MPLLQHQGQRMNGLLLPHCHEVGVGPLTPERMRMEGSKHRDIDEYDTRNQITDPACISWCLMSPL